MIAAIAITAMLAALLAGAATRRLIGWLAARALDVPNPRSMHNRPTPRGGGLVFATLVLTVHAVLLASGRLPPVGWWWWAASLSFAVLGWLDDRRPRTVATRLAAQILIAGVYVLMSAGLPGQSGVPWMALGSCVAAILAVVWAVNLYNFMDGVDGYAATEAILLGVASTALFLYAGDGNAALLAASVTGACAGFLFWNRPPARLFMGDVGSYFLGFEFVALAGHGRAAGIDTAVWLIVAAPFVADATLTLLDRIRRGQAWREAHRMHAYQQLLLRGWSPAGLLLALVVANTAVCWPLAALSLRGTLPPPVGALLAYTLAGIIWWCATQRAPRN